MSPKTRSVILAMIGGMMAAAYLDGRGVVDLSYGFERGGFAEGALMAVTGAIAGLAVLLVFRVLRNFTSRDEK
jgi:predicted GNAT superfamily acetyltransferase